MSPYLELPFEVPDGVGAVRVSLAFDRDLGVLDLGCAGPGGYRGWSGGARSSCVIAQRSTPGYLGGRPEPGEWAVWLGLHRVPGAGIDVEVRAELLASAPEWPVVAAPAVPERPPRRSLPNEPGLSWLAGDLHAHTVHSDGSLTVSELAALAVSAGCDFLAVTDHNTTSHHVELDAAASHYGLTLLPGQEVTTDRGHANAFGRVGWVDFRQPADAWVRDVAAAGGLLSINHPLAADCAWHHPLTTRPPLAEVWHWTWAPRNWTWPLAWWTAWGLDAIPLGGSDFHAPAQGRPLAAPTTWVACEDASVDGVMAGLQAGRTAISAGRDAPVVLRVEGDLVAVGADGTVLVDAEGRRQVVRGDERRFRGAAGPHRLETPMAEIVSICA